MSDQTAVYDEVRRQVLRAHERLRAVRSQVLDMHEQVASSSRRVGDAEASVRSAQGVDDPAAQRSVAVDVAREMEQARTHAGRAHAIGTEVATELQQVDLSLDSIKRDIGGVNREGLSAQGRSDVTALEARVENLSWAVSLARPAALSVTENMISAADRARQIEELTLQAQRPLDPAAFETLNTDLSRAVEGGAHMDQSATDTLRSAEVASDHSELLAEAAHARMAHEQERDIPSGDALDLGGPQR